MFQTSRLVMPVQPCDQHPLLYLPFDSECFNKSCLVSFGFPQMSGEISMLAGYRAPMQALTVKPSER